MSVPPNVREGGVKKPKVFRWASEKVKTFVPGIPTFIPAELSKQELKSLLLRTRIEEIGYKIQNNQLDLGDLTNDQQFKYDKTGRRIHAGESARVSELEDERSWLIEQAYRISEHFKPPGDSRQSSLKLTRKLEIPVEEFPDYNFMGLIIGPRGMTQKQLEKDTSAKISIRGRGSGKDGNDDNPEDPLHVVISGDDIKSVRKAAAIIRKLLVPVEEGENDMKRAQLRKLAEIHGNVKTQTYEPMQRSWQSATVFCKYCGEISHTSMDCPFKNGKPVNQKAVDDEYDAFMKDLGIPSGDSKSSGKPAPATPAAAPAATPAAATPAGATPAAAPVKQTEQDYEAFMNSFQNAGVDLSKKAAPSVPWAQPPQQQQQQQPQQQPPPPNANPWAQSQQQPPPPPSY